MNSQHLLDNFLETILDPDKETINYYGAEVPFPSLVQAELSYQFNLNLKNNVLPNEFEKNIEKVKVGIKYDLEKKYELYYLLLYHICYLRKNTVDLMQDNKFNFKQLNELLFGTEEDIVKYYNEIKQYSLN